jgi:hypothetical protein
LKHIVCAATLSLFVACAALVCKTASASHIASSQASRRGCYVVL